MSQADAANQPGDPLDELLVSYLDGELPDAEATALERRLGREPALRTRLHQLEKADQLLSLLPRSQPTAAFKQVTVTLAVDAIEQDSRQEQQRALTGERTWWIAGGTAAVVALLFGFWGTRQYLAAPNEQLRRDLPVIQRLDEYRTADSVDFLKRLEREGLFAAVVDDAL